MPFITREGIRIRYEQDGKGPPLVLHHGFSSNLEVWLAAGYARTLRTDYQLILIDARGHGASDKPHDPHTYRLEEFADDVVAVLDELGIAKAHYWGYSMGAAIGFEIIRRAPTRFHSFTLGGHTPLRSPHRCRKTVRGTFRQKCGDGSGTGNGGLCRVHRESVRANPTGRQKASPRE